ncbi:hypothetical protein NPX13_g7533 [Xylaria arbuscula]|uniref:Uncharacterized protein n=1 Tax=Xylaria arbuscula TaxID=114810 RepID=A0A9W8NAE6_9PEZI|nr:hypothetical protein NPX13_g7533 [Xylaria arbuscula]
MFENLDQVIDGAHAGARAAASLCGAVVGDVEPLDLHLGRVADVHDAGPHAAVRPDVHNNAQRVGRCLQLDGGNFLTVDVPVARAGRPVVAVLLPFGPGRGHLNGAGGTVCGAGLVCIVHDVGLLLGEDLDVALPVRVEELVS